MAIIKDFRPIDEYPPVLQAGHVREILGISKAKAYEVLNSRKCPTIRMGKRMVVLRDSFVRFLNANEGGDLMSDEAVAA